MPQFESIDKRAEVNGQTVLTIANSMGTMNPLGLKILAKNNIVEPKADEWYSQQDWLNAFKHIAEKIGPATLFSIGYSIPENAEFPPDINDIETALSSIDIAYHMNHRIDGKILFDPKTGEITDGIANYKYERIDENSAKVICDNPYPCDFDKGLIKAMSRKFCPQGSIVKIDHDHYHGCRKEGDESCHYIITW